MSAQESRYMFSKKAISEMVSYTLLVIIAVGLAVFVYNYLSVFTPKEHATCSEDVRIILQSYSCRSGSPGQLNITLLNKGIFSIDASYIRFGPQNRKVKEQINKDDIYFTRFVGDDSPGLAPGESITKNYSLSQIPSPGRYGVEIEPAVFSDNDELALCPQAVIVQELDCT
jgi:hypothetical protein